MSEVNPPPTEEAHAVEEMPATTEALPGADGGMDGLSIAGLDLRGYELLERLGGGGMGDVYRAGDPALGRDLAVKVMKAELQGIAAAEQRFLREARVTGSLQHPGIVPIYNLGRLADGRLHYTMRLVRGRTLAEILKEEAGKPEHVPGLLTIFEKVCQAAAYAHSKQVIHRDLKPANVMVGRFGEVQVMDWGLAKLLTPGEPDGVSAPREEVRGTHIHTEEGDVAVEMTRFGREMGTPAYMPLEQALGEWDMVDTRADVFALGAILCEILTGLPPYFGSEVAEALRKAKRGDLSEALARLESCGADATLLALCRDCLTPAREARPRYAEQVAQRVASYQAEVQERLRRVELERAEAVVKARELRKRRRWMATAALLLLAGTALSTGLAVWAISANNQLRQSEGRAQARLELVQKSNGVLTSIFQDLDPRDEEKEWPSFRLQLCRRMEQAAAQLVELSSTDDPAAVARLRHALGRSLAEMGQLQQGIELLSKAATTLTECLGADDSATLDTLGDLALAYQDAGQMEKALPLYEQLYVQNKAKFGPDHPETLTSQNNLAAAYRIIGRLDKALPLWEKTLAQRKEQLGVNHQHTLFTMNDLALAYQDVGRPEEALPLLEHAWANVKDRFGPNHQHTLTIAGNLAVAYREAGQLDKAMPLFEHVLAQRTAKLGPDHHFTLSSSHQMALAYWVAGQRTKALPLLEQTLGKRKATLGADHRDTLRSMHDLASVYLADGQLDKALRLCEGTVQKRKAKLGADHHHTLSSMSQLAATYQKAGRLDEALPLYEQTLAQQRVKLGLDHPDTRKTASHLAQAYQEAGRSDQAETVRHELGVRQKKDAASK